MLFYFVYTFTFLLLPLTLCVPLRDKDGKPKTTRTCNEIQYDEFLNTLAQCYKEASAAVDEVAISDGGDHALINEVLCQAIANKVKCNDDHGHKCFNSTQNSNFHHNSLSAEMEKVYNSSSVLGQDFIQTCPILSQNEASVVNFLTGSNACSYVEYKRSVEEWERCRLVALFAKSNRLALLDFVTDKRSLFVNAECIYKKDFETCHSTFLKCFGGQIRSTFEAALNRIFASLEGSIRTNNLDDFSFQTSCGSS